MLRMTQSVWLPDPGGRMTGLASLGKTAITAFLELSGGWPVASALWCCNYMRLSALSVISTSQVLLSCSRIHCFIQSPLRCWLSFTVLHLVAATPAAASVYFSDTGWSEHGGPAGTTDFHTQGDQASRQSVVSLVSDLPVPLAAMKFEIWNTVTAGHFREAQLVLSRLM